MSLTRDQLRAARVLLHLQQDVLAGMAGVGVATIRRFEGGRTIGRLHLDALRRAVVGAGAVLIDGTTAVDASRGMTGVLLRPEGDLPADTRARIAAGRIFVRGEPDAGLGAEGAAAMDACDADPPAAEPSDADRPIAARGRPKGTSRRKPPSEPPAV